MSAQLLPFEVLSQIFPLVPHSTVYQCTLVCKSWNVPATTEFYSTLKLGGRHDFPLNKLAKKLECDHLEFFKHGHLVKRLVLRGKFEEFSGPVAFCSLLSCLPYLKLIDITDCSIASEILEILKSYGKHIDLKYLQDIYAINPKRLFQLPFEMTIVYFKACFSFRETITRLRLNDIENIYYTENNIYQRTCLDLLGQFKQLTHLAIDEHPIPIRVEKNAQFQLPLILQSCPNLTHLRIRRPLPHFDYSRDNAIQQLLPKTTNDAIPSRSDGVYLKMIELFFTVLGASQMEYITSSLCTSNLNSFVIKTRHQDVFFELVQNEEIFMKFVQHISQAKYLYFGMKCRTLEELGPQQVTYENSKVHQIFWKMLHAVEPVRVIDQIFIEIDFLGDQSSENHNIHPLEYPTISCSMEIKKKNLYFHQEITPREFFNKKERYGKTSDLFNSFVKNKTVQLEFLMDSSYFLNILLFVANHLPHIQNLYLKDPGKTPIQSIECFLNYQTSSEDNNNNNNNNKRISSARIRNTFIRATTFIILSEAIPKLETLWIYNCSLSDHMNSSSHCSDQALLDLTALKDLKHLIMDQDDIIKYYKEVIYHFESSNEEKGGTHNLYYGSLRCQGKHAFYPDQRMLNPSFRKSFKGYYVRILLSSKIERISL